jgi:hypothetical protein
MSLFKSSVVAAASGFLMLSGLAKMAGAAYVVGPVDFGAPYTVGAINGQHGWVGAGGADVTNAGGNAAPALFIDNNQVGSSARMNIPAPYNTDTTQTMRVKFDIKGTLDSSNFVMPRVQIGDLGASDWAAVMIEGMAASSSAGSNFRLNGDNTKLVSGITSVPNKWYTVTVDLSFGSKTYDISITDGTSTGTASNVPFWYDSLSLPVPGLNAVLFSKPTSNTYPNDSGYIDNFSVEMIAVPEPGSLALLGMGLSALVLRRRQ